jgi:hypothetical protein
MKQAFTSADTSLNQIPGLYKIVPKLLKQLDYWSHAREVLDYGGGRFDAFVEELARLGTRSFVYDPFNRTHEHNLLVVRLLKIKPARVTVCANVLNVIREPAVRQEALETMRKLTAPAGDVLISTHSGDGDSRGRITPKGWQSHRPTKNYLREVRRVFPDAFYCGGLILAGPYLVAAKGR